MAKNKTIQIMDAARKGNYGIVAAITYNLEGVLGIIAAAEERRSPAMILVFPWIMHFAGGSFIRYIADAAKHASVPISVHLDHCQNEDDVKLAMELPFDSIMVDMSHYELDENLEKTAYYTKLCHERGIATECETGRIQGSENGVPDTVDLEAILTDPDFAKKFAETTKSDILAPAFGNFHGLYPKRKDGSRDINLDFQRLENIIKAIPDTHICIHGTNDWPDDLMNKIVKVGGTKVNTNKYTIDQYTDFVQSNAIHEMEFTDYLETGVKAFQAGVAHCMDVCESTGKA